MASKPSPKKSILKTANYIHKTGILFTKPRCTYVAWKYIIKVIEISSNKELKTNNETIIYFRFREWIQRRIIQRFLGFICESFISDNELNSTSELIAIQTVVA